MRPPVGERPEGLDEPAGVRLRAREHCGSTTRRCPSPKVEYQEQMALLQRADAEGEPARFPELFGRQVDGAEQPGCQIESLRALYDLWLYAAEEGYAEIALSTEFREVTTRWSMCRCACA